LRNSNGGTNRRSVETDSLANQFLEAALTNSEAPNGNSGLETEIAQALRALRSEMSNGKHKYHSSYKKKKKKKKMHKKNHGSPCTGSESNGSVSYDPSLFVDSD
jgi:hypothetical protein